MKDLEKLITEAESCKTVDDLIKFCKEMVSEYRAGKQAQHLSAIKKIEYLYYNGEGSESYRETYARNKLFRMIGNVCLNEKVI
ncbi:MAG: hypothetical protein CBB72_011675 [Muricauda sp. TMED12]|nr:MAG: hypothetical protein CBB72_011675 [Muricauda sp. TMED12]